MLFQRFIYLLIALICLSPGIVCGQSSLGSTTPENVDSTDSQTTANETVSFSQIAFAVAVIVLVVLVVVVLAGGYLHALDAETPEQRLERKQNQEKLKAAAIALSVHHATTTVLQKLK